MKKVYVDEVNRILCLKREKKRYRYDDRTNILLTSSTYTFFICHLPKAPDEALYARSSFLDSTKDKAAASLSHTRASITAGFGARSMPPLPFGGVNIIIAITSKYLIMFTCFYKTPPRISHYPHNLPYTHEQLYEYPPPYMLPLTSASH